MQKTWSYPRQRCPPQAHNGDEGIFPNGTFLGRPVSCREKCAQRWSLGLLGSGAWTRGISGVFLAKGHGSLGASWIFYRFASLLEIGETEGRRAQELPVPPEVRVPEPYGCVGIRHRLDA
ncbi:hypothetical protein HRbin28_00719 [bacterium HR28]|nr:hypothetical protein HRbin28_00719 [bacterium HR28]